MNANAYFPILLWLQYLVGTLEMLIINSHDTKCYSYKAYDKCGPKIDDMKKKLVQVKNQTVV